jgi:DNA (cytosine-5)-methyltransferase 1
MPQRRRRVFFLGYHRNSPIAQRIAAMKDPMDWVLQEGVMAQAFPCAEKHAHEPELFPIAGDLAEISKRFNARTRTVSPFCNAGIMVGRRVSTVETRPDFRGKATLLGDVILLNGAVPKNYFIPREQLGKWKYLKGAKSEKRKSRANGLVYNYSEGAMVFPDPLDKPSRTIITGEGGSTPSRFKHVIRHPSNGRLRRLTPIELERLNMFPDDHTKGASDERRAFLMGNALVTGVVERIAKHLLQAMEPAVRMAASAKGRARR